MSCIVFMLYLYWLKYAIISRIYHCLVNLCPFSTSMDSRLEFLGGHLHITLFTDRVRYLPSNLRSLHSALHICTSDSAQFGFYSTMRFPQVGHLYKLSFFEWNQTWTTYAGFTVFLSILSHHFMLFLGILAIGIVMHITAVAVVVVVVPIFRRLHKIFTPPTIIIASRRQLLPFS